MINEELGKRYSKKNEAMADTKTVSIGFAYADENGSTVTVEKIENGICHVVDKFDLKDVATLDLVQSIYDDSDKSDGISLAIEEILKPKHMNDTYSWFQIKSAISRILDDPLPVFDETEKYCQQNNVSR